MASVPGRFLNLENIIKKVFDETTDSLRTTATLTAPPGGLDVRITDGIDTVAVNSDGSINVNPGNLVISHIDDSIRIGDGTNLITSTLAFGKQGLDVNIINPSAAALYPAINVFNEINSVGANTLTTIASYTVLAGPNNKLQKVSCSGENIAKFNIYYNGVLIDSKRTYFGGELNTTFNYTDEQNLGYPLVPGDLVEVRVFHTRPSTANFNARIQILGV